MNKLSLLIIVFILLLGGVLRLYRIDNPVADWHAWRQADTASVGKIYVKEGVNLLFPKYYDISNVQSGQDNSEGYRLVEFPLYAAIHAVLYKYIGLLSFDTWGRVISITASMTSALMLYLIFKSYNEEKVGLLTSFIYSILPFSIYYGRTILPEPLMVSTILISIYLFKKWTDNKKIIYYSSSIIFLSISLLLKPTAAFFLPVFAVISFQAWKAQVLRQAMLYIFPILTVIPLLLWRIHISGYPEGIPAFMWLFNEGGIRFKGAYFFWIFGERLGKLILGYFATTFITLGLLSKSFDKTLLISLGFFSSSILYLVILARGNVQHDYYQILIIPTVSILLSRGILFFLSSKGGYNYITKYALVFSVLLLSIALSWFHVRDYFNINNINIVKAGQAANKILPDDAKVIAPLDGDTTLLYYTERKGWPVMQQSIEELIQKGATHLVIANPTDSDRKGFGQKYTVLASSKEYLILQL